jgi:hypothetical protein
LAEGEVFLGVVEVPDERQCPPQPVQLHLHSKPPELVVMVYSPHPLVVTEKVTEKVALQLLHLQATSKSYPVIVDELDESGSGIRNEFLKLLLNLYPFY